MVGPILGGSSDVALSANVAPLGDSHFDGCDLLQRSVVPYGACKALATIEDQHMSRECNERMWNQAYRLAHCGEHRNYQAIEWELQAYGYPKRANYCTTHASVKGWMPYAPKRRGPRLRLFDSEPSVGALTIINMRPAQLKNNGAS